jgi:hypothetical protein
MTIISKYQSTCRKCRGPIAIGQSINWERGVSGAEHAYAEDCKAAQVAAVATTTLDLSPVVDFLKATIARGLKSPKLRVLAPDGRSELRMSLTRTGSAPGSISVVINGDFIGCIRPNGDCTSAIANDSALQGRLLLVAKDPTTAAKEYAVLMGLCSFCNKALTDAGSVACGYGPICAKHWGLPHVALGTRKLGDVPTE